MDNLLLVDNLLIDEQRPELLASPHFVRFLIVPPGGIAFCARAVQRLKHPA